ncbi:septum formation initiator family protein, partial [Streptomyces sp. 2MCAF27]
RLHFTQPGETGYSVVDGSGQAERSADQGAADRPWYSNMWRTVDSADQSDQAHSADAADAADKADTAGRVKR